MGMLGRDRCSTSEPVQGVEPTSEVHFICMGMQEGGIKSQNLSRSTYYQAILVLSRQLPFGDDWNTTGVLTALTGVIIGPPKEAGRDELLAFATWQEQLSLESPIASVWPSGSSSRGRIYRGAPTGSAP